MSEVCLLASTPVVAGLAQAEVLAAAPADQVLDAGAGPPNLMRLALPVDARVSRGAQDHRSRAARGGSTVPCRRCYRPRLR